MTPRARPLPAILLALILAIACVTPPPVVLTPSPTPERGILAVTALLDLSGERAPSGASQRDALQLWVDRNPGRPVRLDVVDVGGSDARLALEMRRAVVERHADAIVVGTPAALSIPGFPELAGAAGVPVLLTLPAPEPMDIEDEGARWIFALAPTHEALAAAAVDHASARGLMEFSVFLELRRDAPDPEGDAFEAEISGRAIARVLPVRYEAVPDAEPLLAAYVALARSVHVMGAPREHPQLAPALQAAASFALVYLSYLTVPSELGALRDARSLWPSWRATVSAATGSGAEAFVAAYAGRHGPPTAHAASAYDALSLIADAAARVGPDDPATLRDALEGGTFAGVATTYAFSSQRHAGADPTDLVFVRWDGDAPAIVDGAP